MTNRDSLSVTDKLLIAAYELEEKGKHPFSAEDLVVGAWSRFPDVFGLSGYQDQQGRPIYPDSNRVFAEIMGAKPVRKRGYLRKVGSKMYQLTEAGREQARLILKREESGAGKFLLGREVRREIRKLLTSRAAGKFRNSRAEDITFSDACSFWGISPSSSAIQLEGRLSNFERIIDGASEAIGPKGVAFEHGGTVFGSEDLGILRKVHQELKERFKQEIDLIQRRTDERRQY